MQESPAQAPDTEAEKVTFSPPPIKARYSDAQILDMENQAALRKRADRLAKLIREAGGDRYAGHLFSNYKSANDDQRKVAAAVQEWAANYPKMLAERRGVILHGHVGTGKDHLMFAAVRQAILQHDATAIWQNGRDLFGEVRDRISETRSERDLIAKYEHSDILVLSDPVPVVGALTPHQADMLYRIIENRYAAGKLTCATLNVQDDDDADAKIGAPIWDRMIDGAIVAECRWASHRRPFTRLTAGNTR